MEIILKQLSKIKNNKGFTLIELIIYSAILIVVLSVFLNFIWEIVYGNVKTQAIREVQQNGRFAMEKIMRTIQESTLINIPVSGESADSLSLEIENKKLNPVIFDVVDKILRITQEKEDLYSLTNNRVRVDSLQFTNLSYAQTPGTIRIEMTISHQNEGNRREYDVSQDFVSTISLFKGGALLSK